MATYFQNMNLYHFSYACTGGDDNNYVRARRYPIVKGFHEMQIQPNYANVDLFKPGETWHLVFEKNGRALLMTATRGEEVHQWKWDASSHPPIEEGRLGLRQMHGRKSRYANLKVFQKKSEN